MKTPRNGIALFAIVYGNVEYEVVCFAYLVLILLQEELLVNII